VWRYGLCRYMDYAKVDLCGDMGCVEERVLWRYGLCGSKGYAEVEFCRDMKGCRYSKCCLM